MLRLAHFAYVWMPIVVFSYCLNVGLSATIVGIGNYGDPLSTPGILYAVNPITGAVTQVGPSGTTNSFFPISSSPVPGSYFASSPINQYLLSYPQAGAIDTTVFALWNCPCQPGGVGDYAYDSSNGKLFGLTQFGLVQLTDSGTGFPGHPASHQLTASVIGSAHALPVSTFEFIQGLGLYGTDGINAFLINETTGALTPLPSLIYPFSPSSPGPLPAITGLAYDPDTGRLIGTAGSLGLSGSQQSTGYIYGIDPLSGQVTVLNSSAPNMFGLAAVTTPEPSTVFLLSAGLLCLFLRARGQNLAVRKFAHFPSVLMPVLIFCFCATLAQSATIVGGGDPNAGTYYSVDPITGAVTAVGPPGTGGLIPLSSAPMPGTFFAETINHYLVAYPQMTSLGLWDCSCTLGDYAYDSSNGKLFGLAPFGLVELTDSGTELGNIPNSHQLNETVIGPAQTLPFRIIEFIQGVGLYGTDGNNAFLINETTGALTPLPSLVYPFSPTGPLPVITGLAYDPDSGRLIGSAGGVLGGPQLNTGYIYSIDPFSGQVAVLNSHAPIILGLAAVTTPEPSTIFSLAAGLLSLFVWASRGFLDRQWVSERRFEGRHLYSGTLREVSAPRRREPTASRASFRERHRFSGCADRSQGTNAICAIDPQHCAEDYLVPVVVSRTRGCLRSAMGESGWPVRLLAENGARLEGLLRGQTRGPKTS